METNSFSPSRDWPRGCEKEARDNKMEKQRQRPYLVCHPYKTRSTTDRLDITRLVVSWNADWSKMIVTGNPVCALALLLCLVFRASGEYGNTDLLTIIKTIARECLSIVLLIVYSQNWRCRAVGRTMADRRATNSARAPRESANAPPRRERRVACGSVRDWENGANLTKSSRLIPRSKC